MASSKAYRLSVDYTAATQVEVTSSPTNAKTAFIPKFESVNSSGVSANPMTSAEFLANLRSGTGTKTSVNSGASSVTILASNANRKGATITNTDANTLYLDLSGGTASSTSFSVPLAAGGYYGVPFGYTGAITGIWAADGSGAALVTEFT